jgi:hypothetical protein
MKKIFENSNFIKTFDLSENFFIKFLLLSEKTKWKIAQRKLMKIERKKNVHFDKNIGLTNYLIKQ